MNPIMRKAEEGLGTSNGAEGHPGHISISVDALLASSSAPRDHGSASESTSPSDELSAGGTVCPRPPPTTTTVSGSNTTTSTTSGSAAPNTSIVPIRRDGALNMEIPRQEPRDRDRNDAEIPREGPQEGNDDDNGPFKLGKIFIVLSFSLATALMIVRVQPQQCDSSSNLSSQSSILFNAVRATTIFCFPFTMFGMILKKHHLKVAKICNCIGILLGVLDFFLMISIYTEDSLVWLVRVVAVVVLLASAYFLRGEMGIHSQLSLPCTHRRDG